jgi:hypothetical protein
MVSVGDNVADTVGWDEAVGDVLEGRREIGRPAHPTATMRMNIIAKKRRMHIL